MAISRVYIARHGFRLNWITSNWTSETGLPRDPPLAAYGVTQAEELASYFLSLPENERPTSIFSSPYYRCLQTAKPVSVSLGIPIFVEHGLSEWYSPVTPGTGLHPRPGAALSLKSYFPEISLDWSSIWYPSRKGEDVKELLSRASGFWADFVPEAERRLRTGQKDERVLFMTHAATAIALSMALVGGEARDMRVGCCSISEFMYRSEGWQAIKLADGQHLSRGSERDWGFCDIVMDHETVVDDPGEPGTENEIDEPVGSQLRHSISNL